MTHFLCNIAGALGRQSSVCQQTRNSSAVQHSVSMPAVRTGFAFSAASHRKVALLMLCDSFLLCMDYGSLTLTACNVTVVPAGRRSIENTNRKLYFASQTQPLAFCCDHWKCPNLRLALTDFCTQYYWQRGYYPHWVLLVTGLEWPRTCTSYHV